MDNSCQTLTCLPAPLLLLLFLFIVAAAPALVSADKFVVGDQQVWAPGVNYTAWAEKFQFHVGDWLVFYYQKGYYDVLEVNATAYEVCAADNPIVNWSRGRSFAYQLNRTGNYYFICSRGYCYNGMKLTIVAKPLPATSPAPSQNDSSASSGHLRVVAAWIAAVASVFVLGLS
ncbi:hypothetical protein Cni_G16533 [Canna indica]|uniref:Phytocyanin domain-containing protein n=1 Tax=Canna indica TaxID=4628 RepID=A0AAQ3QEA4_9LILI|nr:hypothetical protein Cni_G16533 [Canna indica]